MAPSQLQASINQGLAKPWGPGPPASGEVGEAGRRGRGRRRWLIPAVGHEDSVLFSQSCEARPGSGPTMKSPSRIFFAPRLGFFHFFTSCQGNQLFEDPAPILQRGVRVFALGVPRSPQAVVATLRSGACNFFKNQSCEVQGGSSVNHEQTGVVFRGDAGGGS